MANDRIDALLAPGYLEGLTSLPMDEVRNRRTECQAVEVSLSYLRRMVQGRLDIVLAEVKGRRDGTGQGDLHSLVDQHPEILSEGVHAPGNGRLSGLMAPAEPEIDGELMDELNTVASPDCLGQLPTTSDEELRQLIDGLSALEREVSGRRKALHERIDALQEEIVRRYKSGEANVDALLK
ncbi:MAG: hypothetical protein QOG64_2502 [Acidimicrobiaceae bacterium]|nr:hypothetical protein [Acidimicrobiaceae bacterium]